MASIPPHLYFELVAFIASIMLFFLKGTPRYMKSFPFFLLLTLLVEIIGWQMAKVRARTPSIWLYNFFVIVTFDYYLFILKNFIRNTRVKKITAYFIWVYPVIALVDIFFIQKNEFHSFTFAFGCLLIVAGCIYYYLELFRAPKFVNLLREPPFWITAGLLFFFCCTFFFFSLINILFKDSKVLHNANLILRVVLFLFYLLLTVGFLCRMKFKKAQ
jgi:hypothetical protein